MKRALGFGLSLLLLSAVTGLGSPPTPPGKGTLATITGSVKDNKGNPLAGALVSLLRDGAKKVIRETRTGADGTFTTTISPGRYGIRAIAAGFNEVVFSAVEVRASQELIYRFNLEPVGSGKTLPELRKDRDDVKWTLRSAQTRRSIFQVQDGGTETTQIIADSEAGDVETAPVPDNESEDSKGRTQGVVESFVASNAGSGTYAGFNFAFATPVSNQVELIFAGQGALGPGAPERLEATGRFRPNDRHRVGVTAAAAHFGTPVWTNGDREAAAFGQLSLRAIDEWIVRDGIVILLGIDYSRFIGAGGAHAVTPRIGLQYDANARTRLRAAYAPGGTEDEIQSVASFEDAEVIFSQPASRPTAFVDGRAIMDRSHRLEIGVERILDERSSVEAAAFYDTTSGRGVGLLSTPMTAFSGAPGEVFTNVANQEGAAKGIRLVYTRRLSRAWTASAGYSFGRGQRLSGSFTNPAEIFTSGFFQTAALQLGGSFHTGTHVRTVLRFSPAATVFAIDPFAGRLGVYDPSLSIQVTQELPSFGLPVRAEAVLDARNILDAQAAADNGEVLTQVGTGRRSLRGGISLRF
jgi:Carboxypeptidase regulatory-like domain/TonB dependent receptor-like, beta-barrel